MCVAPTSAQFYNLCVLSFTQLLHVLALLFRHLQGADIKISLKHTAIKQVTVSAHICALIATYFIAVMYQRYEIVWSKDIRKERKLNIYNALIKSSLQYGSETRRLTENNKRRVEATEMDTLRRSFENIKKRKNQKCNYKTTNWTRGNNCKRN